MHRQPLKMKHILYFTFFSVSVPTLLLLLLLTGYTIHRQIESDQESTVYQLSQICQNMESILNRSESQLNNLTAIGSTFQRFHYCDTLLEKYQHAYDIMSILHPVLTQEPCLGGFFLYCSETDYYYPAFQMHYPYADQKTLKNFLTRVHLPDERNRWIPVALSDRTVLIRMVGYDNTVCAVMVDPALDKGISAANDPKQEAVLFYASESGQPYTSALFSSGFPVPDSSKTVQRLKYEGTVYQLTRVSLEDHALQLCHLIPHQGWDAHLNLFQKLLLAAISFLTISISLIWAYLYNRLIFPLRKLMETMGRIGQGDLSLRAGETFPVRELCELGSTFNQMLCNIHQLKLDAYEKKLDLQQTRLQYLQLQIRPHFYLNCLKGLFSMAENRQYREIQESVLALSDYFRYIFRHNLEFVSFSEEISSVSSYLKLQQLYFSCYPDLKMEISAETTDIPVPPLSVLTFVENSIKHCPDHRQLLIQIRALLVTVDHQKYLNITVMDNCGGFSQDVLEMLNNLDACDFLYKDYHVGIYNIYYRMKLIYKEQATLAFYNIGSQGCAELFIPLQEGEFI